MKLIDIYNTQYYINSSFRNSILIKTKDCEPNLKGFILNKLTNHQVLQNNTIIKDVLNFNEMSYKCCNEFNSLQLFCDIRSKIRVSISTFIIRNYLYKI